MTADRTGERAVAREIADLIHAEAHSGSASWDEVNGPEATLHHRGDGVFVITLPAGWDDNDDDYCAPWVRITVDMTDTRDG
jgi:hypothetical protein